MNNEDNLACFLSFTECSILRFTFTGMSFDCRTLCLQIRMSDLNSNYLQRIYNKNTSRKD